jgi:hypothetical protein
LSVGDEIAIDFVTRYASVEKLTVEDGSMADDDQHEVTVIRAA